MFRRCIALLAAAVLSLPAAAHDYELGTLAINHPWSRPTMPGMSMGVAYLSITNRGAKPDALIGASMSLAESVEIHQTRVVDGMARMRPMSEVPLPAGATVKIEPGGTHLMLVGLKEPLVAGRRLPLTLEFREAGSITVELSVESRDPPPAAENLLSKETGMVLVTARRPSSLPTHIPTTIEGIRAETLARAVNAIDSEDALKYLPSLNVRKRYVGDFDHAVLASRASGTQNSARSLVYVDGILLSNLLGNGATFTPRWGLVTPEEIERVDVLYGPFSAAYPGNSVGAVVDYVTRMPEALELRASLGHFGGESRIYGAEHSYGGWRANASYGDAEGDTSWWVNLGRLDTRGHPLSYATRLRSAGSESDAGTPVTGARLARNPRGEDWWLLGATNRVDSVQDHARIKFAHAGETWRVAYTAGAWHNEAHRDAETWLRDTDGMPVYAGTVNIDGRDFQVGPTEISRSHAGLTHLMHGLWLRARLPRGWDAQLVASLYDFARDLTRTPAVALPLAVDGGAGRIADQSGTGWNTIGLRATWHGERDDGGHLLEFGVSEENFRLRSEVNATADWLRGPPGARISAFRGDTRLRSLFAQDSWRFHPDWRATLGARLEQWRADKGAISNAASTLAFPRRTEDYLSPKFALAWSATAFTTLKVSAGRAVRMPTVSELFQGSIAADAIVNHDPDLAPERSWTGELSAVNGFAHGDLRTTLFFEDTRDALYSQVDTLAGATVTTLQNIGRVRTRGLELAARWQASHALSLDGSVTYAHSRILENRRFPASEDRRQPRVPDWRANLLASCRLHERLSAAVGARYSGLQYNQLDNADFHGTAYTGTSRFLVFDARLRYEGEHFNAAVGVDNLGNERYWAFHPYARRTYNAELSASL